MLSRRDLLRSSAAAAGAALAAPMLNLGRFRLFAHSLDDYSARTIALMAVITWSSITRTTTSSTTSCGKSLVWNVPAGGLDMPGARARSAEEIVLEMRRNAEIMPSRTAVFGGQETTVGRVFGPPGRGPGGIAPDADAGDVLGTEREKEMFHEERF